MVQKLMGNYFNCNSKALRVGLKGFNSMYGIKVLKMGEKLCASLYAIH